MTELFTIDQTFIRKLTNIVLANLQNENFGVKELAHDSGMSQKVLRRKLHALNRKTANQFIREVRLQKALEITGTGHSGRGIMNWLFHGIKKPWALIPMISAP
jgi:AraC-like DNA-binding protein